MNNKPALRLAASLAALGLSAAVALAADGSVTINNPPDGATLDAMAQHELVYEVDPGPRGDHVHVYVGETEVGILKELSGKYTLPTLEAGERKICIRVVNRAHVPIGTEGCVTVTVQ